MLHGADSGPDSLILIPSPNPYRAVTAHAHVELRPLHAERLRRFDLLNGRSAELLDIDSSIDRRSLSVAGSNAPARLERRSSARCAATVSRPKRGQREMPAVISRRRREWRPARDCAQLGTFPGQ